MTDEARLAALEAQFDRELEAIGMCPWLQAMQPKLEAQWQVAEVREQLLTEIDAHTAGCTQCQRRREVTERFADQTSTPAGRILYRVFRWYWRQPIWLRPALAGGALMGLMSAFRLLLLFAGMPVLMALAGLGASVAIGFGAGLVGGNSYRILRPKADEWGPTGPYLAGLLFALTFGLATSLVLWAIPGSSEGFREGWAWKVVGVICLIVGPILGFFWFRPGKGFKLG